MALQEMRLWYPQVRRPKGDAFSPGTSLFASTAFAETIGAGSKGVDMLPETS